MKTTAIFYLSIMFALVVLSMGSVALSQPDLLVSSITHIPRYPVTNDFVTFTVVVTNQGDQQAGSNTLYISVTGPKNTTYSYTVPVLNPGETFTQQFNQKLVPKGTYQVSATVDYNSVVAESDETNNTTVISVTSTTPNKEDLVVEVLEWTPLNPSETDTITITAGVKNIGPNIASASTLELDVGGETAPPTYSIPSLDSGIIHYIQRQVTLAPGTYQITATADLNDVINEADENNNVTIESMIVSAVPRPDLVVSTLDHSPASPTITDTITITAIVENTGDLPSTTSTLEIDVAGEATPPTYEIPILDPLETHQVQRQITLAAPGSYQVTATADLYDDNAEKNETNNTDTDTIQVTAPDLQVTTLSHSPLNPLITDTITITAIVENTGDSVAGASTLEIDVAGEATPATYAIGSLDPAETFQVQRQITLSIPGSYQVIATADLDDDVTESNENNNTNTDNIQVTAPDLRINTLGFVPVDPTNVDTITITSIVENIGNAAATTSTLEIDLDNEATPPTYEIPILAPMQTFQVQRHITLSTPGSYELKATADLLDVVVESNENNNISTDTITVAEAADLIVSTLTHAPPDPTIVDTITITAVVRNQGSTIAPSSTLEIDVDGEASPPTYAIPTLNPGDTHQVQRQINLATPGSYQVTATADIDGDVAESNENNNTNTDNIRVTAPDLQVTILSHAPADPTNIDTITITAIVQNTGDAQATTSTLEIEVDGDAVTFEVPPLAPTATYQAQRQIVLGIPGNYGVTAIADLNDDVAESNENNNTNTDNFDVAKAPDLEVTTLSHAPIDPLNIDDIIITAIVENAGDVAASSSTLEIDVQGDALTFAVPPLAPTGTHQVQRQLVLSIPGIYGVTAIADPGDDIAESDETNNSTTDTINVTEAADLIITSLVHAPANPTITDSITITAIVENRGNTLATTSTLEIDVDGELVPPAYKVPPLSPMETYQVQRQISLATPGIYQVTATADLDGDVPESNELNNTSVDNIDVAQALCPDLVIGSLSCSPEIAITSETITIHVEIVNVGDALATTTSLWLLVDDETVPAEYIIPPLDIATSFTVERSLWIPEPGSYPVTASADVFDEIFEWDEGNNEQTIILDVYMIFIDRLKDFLLDRITFTDLEKRLYDVNEDSILDIADLVLIRARWNP